MLDVLRTTTKISTIFLVMAVFLFSQNTVLAATTGQVYPTLGTTAAESPWLDNNWTTPTNIYSDNAATANVTAASYDNGDQTYVLKATGFDFSAIPDGSIINGVTARINAFYRSGQGSGSMDLCQLLDISRAKVGTNNCSTPTALTTTTSTVITKGGTTDTWGNALTTAWVKDADFGIALGIIATAANADVDVDYVTLEIDYTPPTTTLGNGTDPGNTSLAPSGSATMANAFTLVTSGGTDAITAVVVGLAAGTSGGLSLVEITNDAGTVVHGSTANPASDTPSISLSGLTATTGSTQYKIRVTPKTHANMPVPPGSTYSVTAKINSWTGTNTQAGSDTAGATVTIDNTSPSGTTGANAVAGDTQISVSWSNPGDADFQKVIIYCKTSSITETPTEGTDPSVDGTACDATARVKYSGSTSPQVFTGLTNGTTYYFRIYARDTSGNFAAIAFTQQVSAAPSPTPTTALSDFVTGEPGNSTIAPGASGLVDAFGLQTNTGSDTVTGATVTLAAGTGARIATVALTNNSDTVTYCSAAPSGDTATLSGCSIPVTTTNTQFKIKITAIAHTLMPPPGGLYAVTGTITAFTSTNAKTTNDSGSSTLTIDNLSPADVTSATGSAGNAQVTLNWVNPADSDFNSTVVLRATSAVTNVPTEGTIYTVGNTVGSATVACVVASPTATCVDSPLTNGIAYHYKIFSKDTNGNYAAGVVPTGSPFTPSLSTFTITSSAGAGGTISPLGVTNIAQGSSQSYTMTPDLGYDVATLVVDGSSVATSTSYSFNNVQQNHTIAVTFIQVTPTYTITSTAGANGTISPLGATVFLQGASQAYTITPISGYIVDTLTVDGGTIATSTLYTFTSIQANHTIAATFALIPPPPGTFAITATAGANGSISPTGVTIVTQGNAQAYTITPDAGYDIATLVIDEGSVATSTSYTFTNVQANHTIVATFAALATGAVRAGAGTTRATTITFSGKAFPRGRISVIDKQLNTEKIVWQDEVAGKDGSFSISFVGVLQALHSFGLLAKDSAGRASQSKFFFINTISDDLIAKDILLPPTVALEGVQVKRGANATIIGSATPGYTIHLELDGILIKEMIADPNGTYKFEIPTGTLDFGPHPMRTKQADPLGEKQSDFSTSRTLTVSRLAVVQADLNGDGKIDIRDWSIFLSLWGSKNKAGRERIDFNKDGKIDIADFSIFIKTIRKK